jgi:hypothetical protein
VDIIIAIIIVFAISIIVLSFVDLKLSVAFYISYLILVPNLQFQFAGVSISYNLVNMILLGVFLYQFLFKKKINLNYEIIIPFLFLYFSLLFLSIFTWGMPWSIQFNYWRFSFMQTCILPLIIWNISTTDQKSLIYIKWSLIISISIAGIYGLFLMKMEGLNPYSSIVSTYSGVEDAAETFANINEARLNFSNAGKIQSTMNHPMTWTLTLCFLTIVFTTMYLKTKRLILWVLIGLIGFNILISGVRTGIAALAIGFLYFLIQHRKIKLIVYTLLFLAVSAIIIQSNDDLSNLFKSFYDISGQKSEVHGSSISMRIEQFQGVLNEINGHEWTGRGYGWNGYYISLNGDHPVLLAFESLLFIVPCNSGIIGSFLWILFFIFLFRSHRKILNKKDDVFLMDSFVIVYVAYATGTGEYGYLSFFAIYYTFLVSYLLNYEGDNKKQNQLFYNKQISA